ncbi:MAG: hypothetical protein ACTSSJ_07045 [Candidatus Odinarchaeia archaeon]
MEDSGVYTVFLCPRCNSVLYIPTQFKLRLCSKCGEIVERPPGNSLQLSIRGILKLTKMFSKGEVNTKENESIEVGIPVGKILEKKVNINEEFKTFISRVKGEISIDEFVQLGVARGFKFNELIGNLIKVSENGLIAFVKPWILNVLAPFKSETPSKPFSKVNKAKLRRILLSTLKKSEAPVSEYELIDKLESYGFYKGDVERMIEYLSAEGVIIQPCSGYLKLVYKIDDY